MFKECGRRRTTTYDDGRQTTETYLSYKLTIWAFGSGELKIKSVFDKYFVKGVFFFLFLFLFLVLFLFINGCRSTIVCNLATFFTRLNGFAAFKM